MLLPNKYKNWAKERLILTKQFHLILLVFSFLILSNSVVFANSITFPEIGTFVVPENIEVSEHQMKSGSMVYTLRVHDNTIWRGATILSVKKIPGIDINNTDLCTRIINRSLNVSGDVIKLETEQGRMVSIGGSKIFTGSMKLAYPETGVISSFELYIFKTDDTVMLGASFTDADAQYWRPILLNMLTHMQG